MIMHLCMIFKNVIHYRYHQGSRIYPKYWVKQIAVIDHWERIHGT